MVQYYVPKAKHTVLIGKGGVVVTRLSRTYEVRINIPRHNDSSNIINISGTNAERVKACVKEIEQLLGFKISTSPLEKAFCHIPSSKYAAILGKARTTLNEIEALSECGIHVPFRDDPSEIVVVEGTKAGIEKAIKELEKYCKGAFQVDWGAESAPKAAAVEALIDFKDADDIHEVLFFPDNNLTDGWNFDIFLKYLRSAKLSMDICVFTMTDDRVAKVLLDNHKKGVKIRIITDNDTAKDNGSDIGKYQDAGIPCKVDKSPYHMHNKFCVIDNAVVLNGSYNWTVSASTNNRENIMITNNEFFVKSFHEEFARMWADTTEFEAYA